MLHTHQTEDRVEDIRAVALICSEINTRAHSRSSHTHSKNLNLLKFSLENKNRL